MNIKLFIVCLNRDTSLNIAKNIITINDELTIAPVFTTNILKNEINENYETYMDVSTINLSYKNNSLLYIKTNNHISKGITLDDFYNNDICIMNIEEYNLIPENIFSKYDILTIWVDSKQRKAISSLDMIEIKYFNSFIENHNYLYFFDTESNIAETIIDYINGDEEQRKLIMEENS